MAYCSKCGAELSNGAKFCPKCGSVVGGVSVSSSQEPDFDQNYFEGMRQRNLADAEKYTKGAKRSMVLGVVSCIAGYFLWQQEGFGISCLSILAWFAGVIWLYTGIISNGYYSKKVSKLESMTAHDLYIEKKRNSQMWQDVANGAKTVNTGLTLFRLFS